MSTPGKVLIILIMLALLGWMFLASIVAQSNINWGKRVQEVSKEVEELKKPLPGLRASIAKTTYQASTEQVALDRLRRDFRVALAMAQKTESETKESLDRINFQLAAAKLEAQGAQRRADKRLAERIELEKQIDQVKGVVAQLIVENKLKADELAGLQKAFLTTVAENKSFVQRLMKQIPTASVKPRTRLGSLVH